MEIKFKKTLSPNKKKVVVYYQDKKFKVGHIKKTIEWAFYPSDIPIGVTTQELINKEVESLNDIIRKRLLSSPLRVDYYQSKINNNGK